MKEFLLLMKIDCVTLRRNFVTCCWMGLECEYCWFECKCNAEYGYGGIVMLPTSGPNWSGYTFRKNSIKFRDPNKTFGRHTLGQVTQSLHSCFVNCNKKQAEAIEFGIKDFFIALVPIVGKQGLIIDNFLTDISRALIWVYQRFRSHIHFEVK